MFRKTILLSFLFLLLTNINAQDKVEEEPKYTFDVYLYGGIGVSYYYYKCENSSLRADLDFSSSYSNEDGEETRMATGNTSEDLYKYEDKNSNTHITFASHYFYNFYKSSYGKAYLGIGPFINYSSSNYENNNEYPDGDYRASNSYTNDQTEWSIGISAIVGLKSNLTKSLYLFAETKLSGAKSFLDQNYKNNTDYTSGENYFSENGQSGDGWYYNLRYVRVGIGISL